MVGERLGRITGRCCGGYSLWSVIRLHPLPIRLVAQRPARRPIEGPRNAFAIRSSLPSLPLAPCRSGCGPGAFSVSTAGYPAIVGGVVDLCIPGAFLPGVGVISVVYVDSQVSCYIFRLSNAGFIIIQENCMGSGTIVR